MDKQHDSSHLALPAPAWAQKTRALTDHLVLDFMGGPRPWKFAWVINFQKAGTFVLLLALMVWHWLPALVLAWVWLGLFTVNMRMKEASMSRHAEWPAYKARSWWLIPYVL